jgi:proteic killer suppression protein
MIRNFRHKGLRRLFEERDTRGVPALLAPKLRRMLAQLNVSAKPSDMDGVPGWRLHSLKGELAGFWSVTVTGNWRVVFRFDAEDAADVDFVDYH